MNYVQERKINISEKLMHILREQVQIFLRENNAVQSIIITSTDGFELASAYRSNNIQGGKISAVSSSILALVDAFLAEVNIIGCQLITLNADNGKAFIGGIGLQKPMILVVITNDSVLLGQILHSIKELTTYLSSLDIS